MSATSLQMSIRRYGRHTSETTITHRVNGRLDDGTLIRSIVCVERRFRLQVTNRTYRAVDLDGNVIRIDEAEYRHQHEIRL